MSTAATAKSNRTPWQLVAYIARRAVMMEVQGYLSLYRWLFRRPKVPAGVTGFSYHEPVLLILIVFIVVSAIELVVVDVLVRQWATLRAACLILGVWGVVYMLGLLAGMLTRPHAVGPDGIRVRHAAETDINLPWDDIHSVSRRQRTVQDKQPKLSVDENGATTLHMRMQKQTNLEVQLEKATTVRLPHGIEVVSTVALYADDPKAFMDEVRRHI